MNDIINAFFKFEMHHYYGTMSLKKEMVKSIYQKLHFSQKILPVTSSK